MEKTKICYLINVPWRHIFQRPHVLALELEKDYECTVIEEVYFNNFFLQRQNKKPKNKISIFQLPKREKIEIVNKLSLLYTKRIISKQSKDKILWLCHPSQYKYIPRDYSGRVIYDCMDVHSLLGTSKRREESVRYEKKLIERADLIFASSQRLVDQINKPEKTYLVRNGYMASDKSKTIKESMVKSKYSIAYFGTVSSWFDFPLIMKDSERNSNLKYKIIGPVNDDVKAKYQCDSISFVGPVKHEELYDQVKDVDALIMPFVVNELILSVDPVKLYEYINFGKCIISIWYPEIDRFSPYVYFYRNEDEYGALVQQLSRDGFPPKYTEEQRLQFLNDNTWEKRYCIIKDKIEELINR